MLIDWFKLAAALVLLVTPIGLFHGKKVRHRMLGRDWHGYWRATFTLGLHWIDFGRAILGSWLLSDALTAAPGASSLLRYAVPLASGAIMGFGVILQTFVCKELDAANAPFAFVTGLVLGAAAPLTALVPILLGLTIALGTRAPVVFFPVLALALPGIGFLFEGKKALLALGIIGAVVLLPWLLSLMFPRELVVTYRARRNSATTPSDVLR